MTADAGFHALPMPESDSLTMYFFGPGFGESIVLSLPGGVWMVVDCCALSGDPDPLPAKLLRHFGVSKIDLLVLTHPDLDHIRGLKRLVKEFQFGMCWRYPDLALVRDLLCRWVSPSSRSLAELREATMVLEEAVGRNQVAEACYDTKSWRPTGTGTHVECLAPLSHDVHRSRRFLRNIVEWRGPERELSARFVDYLIGEGERPGDAPNLVSLALLIKFRRFKVLLGGDVENGDGSEFSGWRGIQRRLTDDGKPTLLNGLTTVKVAHHGSNGAFEPIMWSRHSRGGRVRAGIVTAFTRGAVRLPDISTLRSLQSHLECLVVPSNGGRAREHAVTAGWVLEHAGSGGLSCGAIVLRAGVDPSVYLSGEAARYSVGGRGA